MKNDDLVLAFLVRHVWLDMRVAVEDELREHGLTVPQFATLLMLEERPGMTVADVARSCGSTRQSANEMVARLEQQGLLTRAPHPNDRRAHQLTLTAAGRERFEAAAPAVRRREDAMEAAAGFTEEQRAQLRTSLALLSQAAGGLGEYCTVTD